MILGTSGQLGAPIPLPTWISSNPIQPEMFWLRAAHAQFEVLRQIPALLPSSDIFVVGAHRSKSIKLPVVEIRVPKGLTINARGNFHNWAVSVRSDRPLSGLDTSGFDMDYLDEVYFEGFVNAGLKVYAPYRDGAKEFSFHADYSTTFFLDALRRIFAASNRRNEAI